MLGSSLGRVVRNRPGTGQATFDTWNDVLLKSRSCREARGTEEGAEKFQALVEHVSTLAASQLRTTARSFNTFLALTNAAEANHRVRQDQAREMEAGPLSVENYYSYPSPEPHDTTLGAVQRLLRGEPIKLGFSHGRCSPVAASATRDRLASWVVASNWRPWRWRRMTVVWRALFCLVWPDDHSTHPRRRRPSWCSESACGAPSAAPTRRSTQPSAPSLSKTGPREPRAGCEPGLTPRPRAATAGGRWRSASSALRRPPVLLR